MKVTKYDNFINIKLLGEIQELTKNCIELNKYKFTNYEKWPEYVVKDSEKVLVWDIKNENENIYKKICNYVEIETGYKDVMCCYIHCWKQSSFIPWHTDGDYDAALTIYLNDIWDKDWGGYFMYQDKDGEIKCVIPKENLAILQENSILHSTTMTTPSATDRITLQLFLNNKIENSKKLSTLI